MISEASVKELTIEDLFERFGPIAVQRLRLDHYPATEEDVEVLHNKERKLYELKDGLLLEKIMGFREGYLAAKLIKFLSIFVDARKLGIVNSPDGMMRLAPGLIRIPDVSFISWDQLPNRKVTPTPIPDLYPDLAVEVLSAGNSEQEMAEKCQDYFDAGTRLIWLIDPDSRSARVFTPALPCATIGPDGALSGGDVLPGFEVSLHEIFADLADIP